MGYKTETIAVAAATTLSKAQCAGDAVAICDTSGAAYALTLPEAPEDGSRVTVKRDGGNAVTITPSGSDTVEGGADKAVETDLFAYTVQYDAANTNWAIIASHDLGAS